MERYELGADERLSAMVAAANRGEEVILTHDGADVAEVKAKPAVRPMVDLEKLAELHAMLGPLTGGDVGRLVREMREADDH